MRTPINNIMEISEYCLNLSIYLTFKENAPQPWNQEFMIDSFPL